MTKRDDTTHLPPNHLYSMVRETLAIQLYTEHRTTDSTVGWFDLSHKQRTVYRKMATGNYKLPTARKKR